eukprot:3132408-Prymnesium_polylepis.1
MPGDPSVRAWACFALSRAGHERGGGRGLASNPEASRAVLQVDGTPSARCSSGDSAAITLYWSEG